MIDKERTVSTITANNFITQAQELAKGKVCTTCKEYKLFSEFYKDNSNKSSCWGSNKRGVGYHCKSCHKEYQDNICPFKKWFQRKKGQAKINGIEFTIEPEGIPGVKIRQTITESRGRKYTSWEGVEYPKVCPVLGMKLDWSMNGNQPNSPSLDRDNSKLGYIKGNVTMMSNLANMMKSNATSEQLKQFSRYFLFENNK